jgi:hypothetical protein
MIRLAAMQSYFFPYVGYFQLIAAVDTFILYDYVAYIRRGWVNRNRLLRVGQEPFFVTVPVCHQALQASAREICIDNSRPWRQQMRKCVESNYRRAAFFDEVYPLVEQVLGGGEERLSALNFAAVRGVCDLLGLTTRLVTEHPGFAQVERELIEEGADSTRSDPDRRTMRVIKLSRLFDAPVYINPIGGVALYDKAVFAGHGVTLRFVQTRPYSYVQRAPRFFPHLSILDVLMNCGREGTRRLLREYDLI